MFDDLGFTQRPKDHRVRLVSNTATPEKKMFSLVRRTLTESSINSSNTLCEGQTEPMNVLKQTLSRWASKAVSHASYEHFLILSSRNLKATVPNWVR